MGTTQAITCFGLLGRLLAQSCRGSDIACRYGGEEFVLIMPSAAHSTGMLRAERLRKAVAQVDTEFMGRNLGGFSISLGVASLTAQMHSGAELLKVADGRLYDAKGAGRNCVVGEGPVDV